MIFVCKYAICMFRLVSNIYPQAHSYIYSDQETESYMSTY